METRHFQKLVLRMKLQSFTCHIVNMRVLKYVFTRFVFKIKIFHSCRSCSTRVAIVSFLQHSFALVLQSCRSCLTRIVLISLVSRSCCIRVGRVAFVPFVSGTRVANQTRPSYYRELICNSLLYYSSLSGGCFEFL